MSADTNKATPSPAAPPSHGAAGPGKPPPSPANVLEVDAAIRAIGFIFYNTVNSRWFSSSDRKQTLQEGHSVVATVLDKLERLRFTVDGDEIKVNGDKYEAGTVHVKAMVSRLSGLDGCNFTFAMGLTLDEFTSFMELICRSTAELLASGGFIEAVTGRGYQHVTSKKIVLREVSEEEVVVAKSDVEGVAAEERKKIESDVLTLLSATAPAGEPGPDQKAQATSLRKAVQDSEQMADIIMQAVDKKQGGATQVDKQQVAQIVVECLDKAFEALLDDPFSKTQKGKKAIAGALQRLEKELLAKMEVAPEKEESQAVTTAVERMTERLKMDSIVQEYSKKLKALEDSELRILRFIKLQGLDKAKDPEFEKRLSEEGVDVSDWHRLLGKSDAGDGEEAAAVAVAQLATLLGRIEKDVTDLQAKQDPKTKEQLAGDLKQVNAEVRAITEHTQQKINGLVEAVTADMAEVTAMEELAARSGRQLKMSRKKMLVVLAEVVQELCQPLAVISCSIDMLQAKALGEVNDAQVEVLQMVGESAARIKTLIDNLEGMAGQPTTLQPDKQIQQALYQ